MEIYMMIKKKYLYSHNYDGEKVVIYKKYKKIMKVRIFIDTKYKI